MIYTETFKGAFLDQLTQKWRLDNLLPTHAHANGNSGEVTSSKNYFSGALKHNRIAVFSKTKKK